MALATTLVRYLIRNGVGYQVLTHPPTWSSAASAHRARVPGACVAKSVLLKDNEAYLLAVLPATSRLRLERLRRQFGRNLRLAREDELETLFQDCSPGAVPPFGPVYGLDVVVDESLLSLPHVYFEGGDHYELIKIAGRDFSRLLARASRGRFSGPLSAPSHPGWQVSSAP